MSSFLFIKLVFFVLLAAVLSGCGSKPAVEQSSGETKPSQSSEIDNKKAAEDLEKALDAPIDTIPVLVQSSSFGFLVNYI